MNVSNAIKRAIDIINQYGFTASSNSNSTVTSNKDRNQLSYTEASVRIGGNFTIRCNETKKIILEFLVICISLHRNYFLIISF